MQRIESFFASAGFEVAGKPLVVISPCSSQRARNFRNWRAGNFAAVVRHLLQRHSANVIVTGGPSALEKDYGAQLAAAGATDLG